MIRANDLRTKSTGEILLAEQLRQAGITFMQEVKFHPNRKWRFDFALLNNERIAVEVEGVTRDGKAHHQNPEGYADDCEKYNHAAADGWRVFRFTQAQINDGSALAFIKRVLGG